MRWAVIYIIFCFSCLQISGQSPQIIGHIDSMVTTINKKTSAAQIYIDSTNLIGLPEVKITGYIYSDTLKKVVARFRNSDRIREVYFGPGDYYENKVIYIKDYDAITNALYAEVYVWERKLVKSIISDPVNVDEIRHPERLIDRANYEIMIDVKRNRK